MNQEVYAMRMEDNVDDKLVILDFIEEIENKDFNILDFGCGSGSIFKRIYSSFPNARVVGFDKSDFMIKRAKENHPMGVFFSTYEELDSFKESEGDFKYIILNSLLHEVYSYGNGFKSVVELIQKLSGYLTNDGRFIVRDGILDIESIDSLDQIEQYKLRNVEEGQRFLQEYNGLSPFPNNLKIEADNIIGPWHEVREFLNKYTWGFDSLYREAKEMVNFATIEKYQELFSKAGFTIEREILITQEEYFKYVNKVINIRDVKWNTKIIFSASRNPK